MDVEAAGDCPQHHMPVVVRDVQAAVLSLCSKTAQHHAPVAQLVHRQRDTLTRGCFRSCSALATDKAQRSPAWEQPLKQAAVSEVAPKQADKASACRTTRLLLAEAWYYDKNFFYSSPYVPYYQFPEVEALRIERNSR
jgi:hypothetical protein